MIQVLLFRMGHQLESFMMINLTNSKSLDLGNPARNMLQKFMMNHHPGPLLDDDWLLCKTGFALGKEKDLFHWLP